MNTELLSGQSNPMDGRDGLGLITTPEGELETLQNHNEGATHRNVGLVIETRPDQVNTREIAWLRHLGVTKIQMGVQSLDDHILAINKRGHTVAETVQAVALLRAAGFKLVLHWMPNLLGATPESDREDFSGLWKLLAPDEIKIYPTQLLEGTKLYDFWEVGEYKPYATEELMKLIADIKPTIPRYCRVNRVIRDIPSTHVVEGNKRTSLRQDVHQELQRRGQRCACIRCREVRGKLVDTKNLKLADDIYMTGGAEEHFVSWVTPDDKLVGFIRLSLPGPDFSRYWTPRPPGRCNHPRGSCLRSVTPGWGIQGWGCPACRFGYETS